MFSKKLVAFVIILMGYFSSSAWAVSFSLVSNIDKSFYQTGQQLQSPQTLSLSYRGFDNQALSAGQAWLLKILVPPGVSSIALAAQGAFAQTGITWVGSVLFEPTAVCTAASCGATEAKLGTHLQGETARLNLTAYYSATPADQEKYTYFVVYQDSVDPRTFAFGTGVGLTVYVSDISKYNAWLSGTTVVTQPTSKVKLNLNLVNPDAGSISVNAIALSSACTNTSCSFDIDSSQIVTLQSTPKVSGYSAIWEGDCKSIDTTSSKAVVYTDVAKNCSVKFVPPATGSPTLPASCVGKDFLRFNAIDGSLLIPCLKLGTDFYKIKMDLKPITGSSGVQYIYDLDLNPQNFGIITQ